MTPSISKRSSAGAMLMLTELLVVLAFFAVLSAVCVRLFVGAGEISRKSDALCGAVMAAQTAAESWRACDGDLTKTADQLKKAAQQSFKDDVQAVDQTAVAVSAQGELILCYDAHFMPVAHTSKQMAYRLKLSPQSGAQLQIAQIVVTDKAGHEIFSLKEAVA